MRHERCSPAGTEVSGEGGQEVLQACSNSSLKPKRGPQRSRLSLCSSQALHIADLCQGEPLQEQLQAGAQNLGHLEKLSPADRTLTHNNKNDIGLIPGSSDNSFHRHPQPPAHLPTSTPKQLPQAAMASDTTMDLSAVGTL